MAASIENVKKGLRTRQAILQFLVDFIAENGWSPTHSEIAEAIGLRSSYSVRWHLDVLEKDGYIRRGSNVSRALVVADEALVREFLEEDMTFEEEPVG